MDTLTIKVNALEANESFLRSAVGAYAARLNPTLETIADIKTAVSEAVTNSIVHGYACDPKGIITVNCELADGELTVEISDTGKGIPDVETAMQDFYTTLKGEERSGLGFTIMKSFMDSLEVFSSPGEGTTVKMKKNLCA